jgi:phage N-6-adenine-methyltransferase
MDSLYSGVRRVNRKDHALYTSTRQDWATPRAFVDWVQEKFELKIDFDVCASIDNAKAPAYFSVSDDALSREWEFAVGWMNPPFSVEISTWLKKAIEQMPNYNVLYVLIPARVDTRWFHELVVPNASRLWFIKGRLNFISPRQKADANSPFPSMLIEFKKTEFDWAYVHMDVLNVPKKARGFL